MPTKPSRPRFTDYLKTVRERNARGERPLPHGRSSNPKKLGDRQRSSWELLREFLKLTAGHRKEIFAALSLLTLAVCLRLIPPYGTKLAIDSALTSPPKPLPSMLQPFDLPTQPMALLSAIAVAVVVVTLIAVG